MTEKIKHFVGRSFQSKAPIEAKGIKAPFDNTPVDSKTFSFDPIPVNSPIGVLCTIVNASATIFLANHAGGGYDCYVSFIGAINHGLGYTYANWVGDNPPGGLSLSVVQVNNRGGFLGTFDLPRQDVGCSDQGRIFTARNNIDPDLYALTASMWTLTNTASWGRC